MKVIFTEDHGSARADDIKDVRFGYFQYLMRYKKAIIATPELVAEAEKRIAERMKKLEKEQEKARELAASLGDVVLEFTEKADGAHLYGSITEQMIADEFVKVAKLEITKDQVRMGAHIKEIGEHSAKIHLVDGVDKKITIKVFNEAGELETAEMKEEREKAEAKAVEAKKKAEEKAAKKEEETSEESKEENTEE